MFISKDFLKETEEISLEAFALKDKKIKTLGRKITKITKELNDAAEKMELLADANEKL